MSEVSGVVFQFQNNCENDHNVFSNCLYVFESGTQVFHFSPLSLFQQQRERQAALARQQQQSDKAFPGKMTQVKEFPYERSGAQPPYKLQKALIDQKIVPCINVRPYVFHDLMMTLPDFVTHFYPELSIEKARSMLQDTLKVILYKGNRYILVL